jgi:hypothetical protein
MLRKRSIISVGGETAKSKFGTECLWTRSEVIFEMADPPPIANATNISAKVKPQKMFHKKKPLSKNVPPLIRVAKLWSVPDQ